MRVLFVGSIPAPTAGGAHGFISTVMAALEKAEPASHTFHFGAAPAAGYDFTWFLSPDAKYANCSTPFAFSVWDLGHRMLPAFPEVSLSGWKFDSREARYREALPRASIVVASSTSVKKQIHEIYNIPRERIIVAREPWNPVLPSLKPDTSILDQHNLLFSKYLFYPAQFWPHKNHITAIDALKLLPEDFRLVFTGADKGNRQHVFNYARRELPVDRVVFLGFVELTQLVALYRHAYATIVPTLMPARSLPVFEAQALGCPVVRADYEGSGRNEGIAALLFRPLSAVEAAIQVKHLALPGVREGLIERGYGLASLFSAGAYAQTVIEALDQFAAYRALWGASYTHL